MRNKNKGEVKMPKKHFGILPVIPRKIWDEWFLTKGGGDEQSKAIQEEKELQKTKNKEK